MGIAREVVELGRAARAQGKVKLRQPLPEAVVVAAERERDAIERFRSLVLEELNVKELRFVSEADELGRWELKANYRTLGPRFGKEMPMVAEAIAALDAGRAADTLRAGGHVGINVNGHEHELDPDDVQLVLQPLEGYQVERAGTHAVALNLEITEDLLREGMVREIVRADPGAAQEHGPQRGGPHLAHARRRRGAARRGARARAVPHRRGAGHVVSTTTAQASL